MVDHVWAVEEKTHMRLTVATNVISGTHERPRAEIVADAELILSPDAIEQIEGHIKDWRELQPKKEKKERKS